MIGAPFFLRHALQEDLTIHPWTGTWQAADELQREDVIVDSWHAEEGKR